MRLSHPIDQIRVTVRCLPTMSDLISLYTSLCIKFSLGPGGPGTGVRLLLSSGRTTVLEDTQDLSLLRSSTCFQSPRGTENNYDPFGPYAEVCITHKCHRDDGWRTGVIWSAD